MGIVFLFIPHFQYGHYSEIRARVSFVFLLFQVVIELVSFPILKVAILHERPFGGSLHVGGCSLSPHRSQSSFLVLKVAILQERLFFVGGVFLAAPQPFAVGSASRKRTAYRE